MSLSPIPASPAHLAGGIAKADRDACMPFGNCGIGEKAIFLGTYWNDRRRYIPMDAVRRVYKRVALSRNGFSGRGMFGSLSYLVVEWVYGATAGKEVCRVKLEEDIDGLLAVIRQRFPKVPTMSADAEKRMEKERAEEAAKYVSHLSPTAQETCAALKRAKNFLLKRSDLAGRLAAESKALRDGRLGFPLQKWVALVFIVLALGAGLFLVWLSKADPMDSGLIIAVAGGALLFLFAGLRVVPTARRNLKIQENLLNRTRTELSKVISTYPGPFPLPVRYAHPAMLDRMLRSVLQGRAETVDEAFADARDVLKGLTSDVRVSLAEYEEVRAVKPMLLLEDYS